MNWSRLAHLIAIGSSSAASLNGSASAQVLVPTHTFLAGQFDSWFGFSVGAADVDDDGIADVLVGAYRASANSGRVRVYSGATGAEIYTFSGGTFGDLFGYSVSGIGDIDSDGHDDMIIGIPGADTNGLDSGTAVVLSGANSAALLTFHGSTPGENFGTAVANAGDVNNDGIADVIVGSMLADSNGSDSGSLRVYSGVTGALLYAIDGGSPGDNLGFTVAGAGDVNNDGFDDFIAGAPLDNSAGTATIYSGATGAVLHSWQGGSPGVRFGHSVSGAGDTNADGFADVLVGAPFDAAAAGSATLFSGADGSVLRVIAGASNAQSGWSVRRAGNVDSDAVPDLIVGAPADSGGAGSATVYSGASGAVIYRLTGDSSDAFGSSVCGAGDLNNDGTDDVIIGAHFDGSGSVRIAFSPRTAPPAAPCFGDADASGVVTFADITAVLANFNVVCQ